MRAAAAVHIPGGSCLGIGDDDDALLCGGLVRLLAPLAARQLRGSCSVMAWGVARLSSLTASQGSTLWWAQPQAERGQAFRGHASCVRACIDAGLQVCAAHCLDVTVHLQQRKAPLRQLGAALWALPPACWPQTLLPVLPKPKPSNAVAPCKPCPL